MKIAIINITGGSMSGGYRKYLCNIIPRMAVHPDVESILCATPDSVGVQDWFEPMPNVRFVSCKPFRFLFSYRDAELSRKLEKFLPDIIFVPVERAFCFRHVPVVNMIQNMEPFVANFDGNSVNERIRVLVQYLDAKRAVTINDGTNVLVGIAKQNILLAYEVFSGRVSKKGRIPELWDGKVAERIVERLAGL